MSFPKSLAEAFDQAAAVLSSTPLCESDSKPIRVMAFKQTGVCSEICRKLRDGEITPEKYLALKQARRVA